MKFSIITACLNSEKTIERTILSVLAQKGVNIEYIVVDGLSSDGTLEIVGRYGEDVSRVISEKDGGVYEALNKGIRAATGDIIGFLHAGDVYAGGDILEKVRDRFAFSGAGSVYGDLEYIMGGGKTVRYWKAGEFSREKIKKGWMPPHPSFFARREVYLKHGFFEERYKIASDYDLMTRFLWKRGISTAYLPEVLVKMATGGKSNRSLKNIFAKSREDYEIMKKQGLGGFKTLAFKNFSKIGQFFECGK